jgi:uncharacterized protein
VTDTAPRVPWTPVIVYVVLACALAWAVCSPLWISGEGLAAPSALPLLAATMYTPALAAIIVVLLVQRVPRGGRLRALSIVPLRPWRRTLGFALIGWLGPIVLIAASVALAAALGLLPLDLAHFGGFGESLRQAAHGRALKLPVETLAVLELAQLPAAGLVNVIATFGEELGWRGFLLPALRPLGTWPALLITGVIWGLWHAPVILLGYNFARPGLDGLGLMVVGTVLFGILIGWLRMRSGSVWPSVVAHGSLNAMGGLFAIVVAAGAHPDPALVGPLGAIVWVLEALVIVGLVLARRISWRDAPSAPVAPPSPSSAG